MEFTQKQLDTVIEELRIRAERIKGFEADTMKEQFVFIGYAEAYEQLAKELEEKGGIEQWV